MFTTSLRRQSPTLLRLTPLSIRALTSFSSSKSAFVRSRPLKTAILSSSSAQRRFFAISSYLRDEASASAQLADLDPPAGEYAHSGHGHEHHFKNQGPITRFQQLADHKLVNPSLINTITKGLGYDEMTKVQQKTILETLNGENVLAQAKTGTGKTIAFLLPLMQRLLTSKKPLKVVKGFRRDGAGFDQSNSDIRAIIVSPTRELATQIAVDAKKLAANSNIIIGTAVGGSGKMQSLREIHRYGCHILIATPGRLLDLLTDPQGVTAPNLEIFVMDEADNLLDVGFAKELDNIMAALPPRDREIGDTGRSRQTLLFSATVPEKVMSVVKATMGNSYKFLRMVEKGESQFHERVDQRLIKASGLENLIPATYELCERERAKHNAAMNTKSEEEKLPFKAIVFFSATRWASLAAETFRSLRGTTDHHPMFPTKVFEIHSRLSQGQRDNAAARFRNADSAILFSSDVTARGMDFPKVTHVIQVGGPRNKEQYIHRLGRTARGSREGVGYLILPDMELSMVLRELRGLPFIEDNTLSTARLDLSAEQTLPKSIADILTTLTEASMRVPREFKSRTYSALLGLYSAIGDKPRMIDGLNRLSALGWGMEEPPFVSPMLARKMGLDRIPGLNTTNRGEDLSSDRSEGYGYGDRNGGGGGGGFSRGRDGGFSRGGRGGRGGFGSSGGRGGGFGSSGPRGVRPWEGRGRQLSDGFGGDRDSFGGYGGGFGGRGGRGGFGGRREFSSYGRNSESDSFSNRGRDGESSGFPSRGRDGESSGFSSRGRGDFGGFSSRGRDGESGGFSSRGRGDFGGFSSRGRDGESGGFSSRGRGDFGGFSSRGRDGESGGFSSRGRGGFGGRGRGSEFGGYSSRGRDSESGGFGGRPSYGDSDGGSFGGRGGFGGRGRGRGGDSFGSERRSYGDRDGGSRDFGGDKPWERRSQPSFRGRGGFSDRGGFTDRGGFSSRGGFSDRGGFSSRGGSSGFGGRPTYGDSEGGSFGGRGGFGGRGRGRGGDSFGGERRSFGDRDSGGERRSFGDRDGAPKGFGDRDGASKGFGDRDGASKGFGDRDGTSKGFGDRSSGGSGGGMSRFDAEEEE